MNTITETQDQIIEDFSLMDDWDDKYAYLIELGKKITPLSQEYKTEKNIIKGCQSKVWIISKLEDGKIFFQADSDALIVKGLIALLLKTYSGYSPEEIISTEPYFIDKIGMQQHLSMTRSNGLASMVKQIKLDALAFNTKN
ncbi:MAG TPA: SufE family protein [Cytophagaceae bacterium]|jgi:cysteine desulfuration protein SufE|nr:SufE family protein [Cytophagaceae bacterium]